MILGRFLAGQCGQVDVRLHAVRPLERGRERWAKYGHGPADDVIEIRRDLTEAEKAAITAYGSLDDVQEQLWVFVGDTNDVATPHYKDVRPGRKPTTSYPPGSTRRRGEFSAATNELLHRNWTLRVFFRNATNAARAKIFKRLHPGLNADDPRALEAAHVIPSTRHQDNYVDVHLRREKLGTARTRGIDRANNGCLIPRATHRAFDERRLIFLPFPNSGYKAPGQPRHLDEPLDPAPLALAQELEVMGLSNSDHPLDDSVLTQTKNLPEEFWPLETAASANFDYMPVSHIMSHTASKALFQFAKESTWMCQPLENLDQCETPSAGSVAASDVSYYQARTRSSGRHVEWPTSGGTTSGLPPVRHQAGLALPAPVNGHLCRPGEALPFTAASTKTSSN